MAGGSASRPWESLTAGRRTAAGAAALSLTALLAGCTSTGGSSDAGDEPEVLGISAGASDRLAVAITIDGLRPGAVTALGPDKVPALFRMMRQGSSTLNARTTTEQTRTMPNHSSAFTGRRVLGTSGHKVTFNDDSEATDIHTVAGQYVPSMFDVVHDRGGRVVFFAGKDKFAFFNRSWDARRGAVDTIGVDNGRDKISRYVYDENATSLVDRVVASLRDRPAKLTYVHIRLPDSAGHQHGFFSGEYLTAVRQASAKVGRILGTIARRDSLRTRTAVVLTADHGGTGKDHGDVTRAVNYTIPFFVWGASITQGGDLYELNPARVEPGTAQPDYFSGEPPVRNLDMASMVTGYLGYGSVPGGLAPGTEPLTAW